MATKPLGKKLAKVAYICEGEECSLRFRSADLLLKHVTKAHPEITVVCTKNCGVRVQAAEELENHKQRCPIAMVSPPKKSKRQQSNTIVQEETMRKMVLKEYVGYSRITS